MDNANHVVVLLTNFTTDCLITSQKSGFMALALGVETSTFLQFVQRQCSFANTMSVYIQIIPSFVNHRVIKELFRVSFLAGDFVDSC